ncbi:hypothetical protein A2704_03540 [Candidatus Kaiserbacteria bacterium RIFCSPHIGHO2_01_FULL_54_36b]|uniref:tRNA-dihydrouridine synthase n=1 Tax=Candidatus Kaiserbacteria bacterium RIFCSPHIGHO2_01_FULL_54_36b TaxID=1798483 RepID=A0A1F6CRY7_9BACT|nr:MAG: hypothetical protein A2704_03540 [Candidatus Kaiserbacteria bacterium RIFCSPHIGHO2_01_FULL_54_36b]
MNFWKTLPKPFFVLAPMADVTDAAFRRVIAKYSKPAGPAVMYTEFVSADGLALAPEEGRKKLLADLMYSESERPIVAQFFTGRPEMMEKAAILARELGFDGVDINMGCPDRSIEKQKAGAAAMKDLKLAKEIIAGAMQGANGLPVSVKTRLGYNKDELETLLPALLETDLAAITIHARTRKEMSSVPARWERMKRAVELRNECQGDALTRTRIIGNGDVNGIADAQAKIDETGADGVMLGRAIFGNPWLFSNVGFTKPYMPSVKEKLRAMVEHTKLFEELFVHPALGGARKSFAIMKKHYKAYVKDFDGAAELRARLMEAEDADAVARLTNEFCATL